MQLIKPIKNAFLKQQHNKGQLNLIVLHGLMGSKANFNSICKNNNISKYLHNAYLLDLRNHGDSAHTDIMTYEAMAIDLKHFIEDHQITNPVLMGHSMGGRVIFSYLQQFPINSILGNIIIDISPHEGEGNNYVENLRQIELRNKNLKQIYEDVYKVTNHHDKTNLILTNLTYVDKNKPKSDYTWKINMKVISKFMSDGHKQFSSQYQGPAVVICGDRSEYVSVADKPIFKKVFPQMDVDKDIHFVNNAGHWVHAEQPREFIHYVSQFLGQLS